MEELDLKSLGVLIKAVAPQINQLDAVPAVVQRVVGNVDDVAHSDLALAGEQIGCLRSGIIDAQRDVRVADGALALEQHPPLAVYIAKGVGVARVRAEIYLGVVVLVFIYSIGKRHLSAFPQNYLGPQCKPRGCTVAHLAGTGRGYGLLHILLQLFSPGLGKGIHLHKALAVGHLQLPESVGEQFEVGVDGIDAHLRGDAVPQSIDECLTVVAHDCTGRFVIIHQVIVIAEGCIARCLYQCGCAAAHQVSRTQIVGGHIICQNLYVRAGADRILRVYCLIDIYRRHIQLSLREQAPELDAAYLAIVGHARGGGYLLVYLVAEGASQRFAFGHHAQQDGAVQGTRGRYSRLKVVERLDPPPYTRLGRDIIVVWLSRQGCHHLPHLAGLFVASPAQDGEHCTSGHKLGDTFVCLTRSEHLHRIGHYRLVLFRCLPASHTSGDSNCRQQAGDACHGMGFLSHC